MAGDTALLMSGFRLWRKNNGACFRVPELSDKKLLSASSRRIHGGSPHRVRVEGNVRVSCHSREVDGLGEETDPGV